MRNQGEDSLKGGKLGKGEKRECVKFSVSCVAVDWS